MDIPLELLSMIGSAMLSGVLTIWSQKLKAQQQQHDMLIARSKLQSDIIQKAREYKGSKGFEFTRRTIALACVASIVVLPKVAALFGYDVTVGWSQIESGFWFWSDDETVVKWHTAKGFVLTPWDTHFVSSIIGFYFGNSVVKNS